jgi:hypothetical protein
MTEQTIMEAGVFLIIGAVVFAIALDILKSVFESSGSSGQAGGMKPGLTGMGNGSEIPNSNNLAGGMKSGGEAGNFPGQAGWTQTQTRPAYVYPVLPASHSGYAGVYPDMPDTCLPGYPPLPFTGYPRRMNGVSEIVELVIGELERRRYYRM